MIMLQIATCLFVMLCIARGKLLQSPEVTEAAVGGIVILKCRTDVSVTASAHPVEWRTEKVHGPTKFDIIYKRKNIMNKFADRFNVIPNTTTGQYDLIIRNVQLSDAGRYTCEDRDDTHHAELIVFDKYPSDEFCTMTSNGDQNACGAETVSMSCDLSYRGNQTLTLEWLKGDNAIHSTVINHSSGSITSSIQLHKGQIETSKFTCRVRYPSSTMTSRLSWSPTMNNTFESTSSLSYGGCDHHTIECSDGKNSHCQYTWKDENGTEVSSSSSMKMAGKPTGNYTCFATCKVHQASCSHVAKIFNYRCHEFSSIPVESALDVGRLVLPLGREPEQEEGQSTSTISHPETIAPPESMISSPGLASPMIYIPVAIAALVILIAVTLLVARVFRRSSSASGDGTQDNQDKNGKDAEMGQNNNNNNNTKMTQINGVKSQEADPMFARNTVIS